MPTDGYLRLIEQLYVTGVVSLDQALSCMIVLKHEIRYLFLGLFAAALGGVLFGLLKKDTEIRKRSGTWLLIIAFFFVGLGISSKLTTWFFAYLSFLALREYIGIIDTRKSDHATLFWLFPAIIAQYYWVAIDWYGMFIIFIPVYLFLFVPLRLVLAGETTGFLRSASVIQWGAMTTIFPVSHVAFLARLPTHGYAHGLGYVMALLVMTASNDVFQFISGKTFKGPKIIPKISPGKTWSGFLGGVFCSALLGALLLPWLTDYPRVWGAVVGALLSVCGFFGDVVESAIKRDIGIKDSGDILPGHGGILDRIDSLIYTAPVFFHLTRYLYH